MSPSLPRVLVVDDEPAILDVVSRVARGVGYDVQTCSGGQDAIAAMQRSHIELVIVDLRMPDIGGLDVVRAVRELDPSCQVVLMTGYASIDTAVEAIKLGAMDYLSKPFDINRLTGLLVSVREEAQRRRSVLAVESELARRLEFCGMIGRGPAMQQLFDLTRRIAPHGRTVLIEGETGTGKELVAKALHKLGPRRDRRFVPINCSAVVETLFESELFGHMRGAFTGATDSKAGLLEVANGGTLFLDEIGELPASVQAKLLRVLETGEVQRVGALEAKRVDVHVIAATNRELRSEVETGRFRSDLYYRLNILRVTVPALRDRREDVAYLTAAFIADVSERIRKPLAGLTAGAERALSQYDWPGNVRELRNVIERSAILTQGDLITEKDLAGSLTAGIHAGRPPSGAEASQPVAGADDDLARVERDHILRTLEQTGGNKVAAARKLGVSRRSLYRKLAKMRERERGDRRPGRETA